MRNSILLLLALTSVGVGAQEVMSQRGEGGLSYREGDPFLFCDEGQGFTNAPLQCWIPLDPNTGTYTPMPWCQPVDPYGKTWSQDDIKSLAEYTTICPTNNRGRWDGRNGQKDMVPLKH